eukprot:1261100-Pyramimonas_sp.AAC.1
MSARLSYGSTEGHAAGPRILRRQGRECKEDATRRLPIEMRTRMRGCIARAFSDVPGEQLAA